MSDTAGTERRAPRPNARPDRGRRHAYVTAAVALLAAIAGALVVVAPSAVAGPVDDGWAASGPAAATVSDGSSSPAAMSYNLDPAGFSPQSWDFTTTATVSSAAGPIEVPWTWQGFHAFFQARASLEMLVDGVPVDSLVSAGPQNCPPCTPPSAGFLYSGTATFNVSAGQTYGFRLTGSNFDVTNILRGTFTLSAAAYVDPLIGTDNRDWRGAKTIPDGGVTGTLDEPDEARWFRFPVVPGQQVQVDLSTLPGDYDVALYGDIQAAFDALLASDDVTRLAAASAAGAPGSETQVPEYPESVTQVPTSAAELSSTTFAPRIYAPRIYAPRIYAPRIYAPRIYAPRIYAPRIYAPDSYVPDLGSDPDFRDAFSAAQNQTLLAVSANTGTQPERVSAPTGNTDGYFYVRVQGHTGQAFSATSPFTLHRTISGNTACVGLRDFSTSPTLAPSRADSSTVIVTDTNQLGLTPGGADYDAYLASLDRLGSATDGVVVDVSGSQQVQDLQAQVDAHPRCPYATNLVARAVKEVLDSYRNDNSTYVVIAGGDEVVPFFRYPDVSGLGQESQFEPPLNPNTPQGASLTEDQVLGQDAYGSSTQVTIGGSTVPLPDLAVGRLVKTPGEITSAIDNYLGLAGGTLPAPTRSLVTGYDFLQDAADAVQKEFVAALPVGAAADTLIEQSGVAPEDSWNADQLADKLLGSRHDLVFLAGHFSANDTLAADFDTVLDADVLAPQGTHPTHLRNTLVLSPGCHSGYNIVDSAGTPVTYPFDWTQRMAQQKAVLIGGTGYQYGDTDFLEYSERLYLDITRRLHEGPAGVDSPPVAVGRALALAKQDYLASLGTLTGIDQKAVLQATLYGLPMTGFDAPRRSPLAVAGSQVAPTAVTAGPGGTLGLATARLAVATPTERLTKSVVGERGGTKTLTWRHGADGVTVQPGAPALPKKVTNVTVPGEVLRGVGFRGGSYTDTAGLLPLTGAPAIEGSTPNSTFEYDAFFPQRLATPNYFGALGASGRTSLVLTPTQYRADNVGLYTNTERAYSDVDLRLYYSGVDSTAYGTNQPALAAPPSTSNVRGTVSNGVVTFSTRVTGDPSAGVQEVWVTWTGGPGAAGRGTWASLDLRQDATDSTLWTGSMPLPAGQSVDDLRFLVQAANGIGAVGLDTAEGDGYRVTDLAGGLPTYSVSSRSVIEGDSGTRNLVYRVTLSHASSVDLAFTPSIASGGTATSGVDYVAPVFTNPVVVPAGEFSAEVTVAVLGDNTVETDETVRLAVAPSPGSPLPAGTVTGVGTIIDDDVYPFGGFRAPVDPLPVVNRVKGGQAVPVKFSLGGNRGLGIFASGSPSTRQVACDTQASVDEVETVTTSTTTLSYDAASDTYNYVWKTQSSWKGTCRLLSLSFIDGRTYSAGFTFK